MHSDEDCPTAGLMSRMTQNTQVWIAGALRGLAAMENHKNIAAASVDPASQPPTSRNRVAQ